MKKSLRRKIHAFLQSEEGKTGVKVPLVLAVISGSFLLTEIMFTPRNNPTNDTFFGKPSLH